MQNNGIDQMRVNDVFSVAGWVVMVWSIAEDKIRVNETEFDSERNHQFLYYVIMRLYIYICGLNDCYNVIMSNVFPMM